MKRTCRVVSTLLVGSLLTLAALAVGRFAAAQDEPASPKAAEPDVLRIGLVDALVRDLSPGRKEVLNKDLPDLMLDLTGYKSTVIQGGDPLAAGKKLASGDWHLGVFPGVQFAWAQARDPQLRPLLLAVNRQPTVRALLMAKKDSPLQGFADLKGKAIYLAKAREHCRLFAAKAAGGNPAGFFGKALPATNVEDALDDVLRGKVQAAVVDSVDLDLYKLVHPGRFDNLKTVAQSEPFPATVIAYRQGALSERVVQRLRAGMLKAKESDRGREAMSTVRISAFEPVPDAFPQLLQAIAKAYPPPRK